MKKLKLNRENNCGAALVEFALMIPVVMLLLIGALDLSIAQFYKSSLMFAAESAARCRAINGVVCATDEAAEVYAVSAITMPGITAGNFLIKAAPCGVQASVSFTYRSMILPNIPISGGVCYP
jgi:hypothetical protein